MRCAANGSWRPRSGLAICRACVRSQRSGPGALPLPREPVSGPSMAPHRLGPRVPRRPRPPCRRQQPRFARRIRAVGRSANNPTLARASGAGAAAQGLAPGRALPNPVLSYVGDEIGNNGTPVFKAPKSAGDRDAAASVGSARQLPSQEVEAAQQQAGGPAISRSQRRADAVLRRAGCAADARHQRAIGPRWRRGRPSQRRAVPGASA